jgi:hydrogenase maturation factor HypF (carbamoyltransferase family)
MATPRTVTATRKHVQVRGVVQGVGFRPFVYKLAQALELTGYVFNSSSGVTIEIEGAESAIDEFLGKLRTDPPQLAEITEISVSEINAQGGTSFFILRSREEVGAFALISPDAGTCDACWRDFGDPMNRRYGYPFTNCTHCGPRYTIIRDIPYDRAATTFGGELKNTSCLTKSRYAILSQHIGDLENYETMRFFEETLANMQQLFKVAPRVAAHDLHPGYMSTRMALASDIDRKIGVQHHHAHIASCMAENHLRGDVIGVAFDGTGFGTDGKIWGGEFLVANFAGFTRRGHLRYVLLPGGDAAIRQPWRMALSYLRDTFGRRMPGDLECFSTVAEKQVELVDTMISRQIQTVQTSSCGRLFDAVAALVGLASEVTFEGQAAIALEMAAVPGTDARYPSKSRRLSP